MCLGIPAKILDIQGDIAKVAIGEVTYQANIGLLDEVAVGDFIILHAGFAIEKVDPAEAEETMRLVREIQQHSNAKDDGREL